MELINDEMYMRMALQLAAGAQGQTGINPVVGCVLVIDGRIVGLGAHLERGKQHAEIHALAMAGKMAAGSTAYVTLEPCSHFGRTGPCCDQLIAEGVVRVVVAATDPDPRVSGSGIAKLRSQGVAVDTGLLELEAMRLNEKFNKFVQTRTPFVTLKTAVTLDGKIAAHTGDSRWVTGALARAAVHTMRHRHDAIMIGAGTAIADDPTLTTRLPVPGLHPTRIIVDSTLRLPASAQVYTDRLAPTIVLTTTAASIEKRLVLQDLGIELIDCGSGPLVDLVVAMELLGEREICSVLLEGGGKLNGAMLQTGLVDKVVHFIAPKLIGGLSAPTAYEFEGYARMDQAITLTDIEVEKIGDDICITGYPQYERSAAACSPDSSKK